MAKIDILNLSPAQVKAQLDQAVAVEQAAKKDAEAKRVDAELDQRARRAFFQAQPGASEAAYLRIAETLKEGLLLDDARHADSLTRGQLHSIYGEL